MLLPTPPALLPPPTIPIPVPMLMPTFQPPPTYPLPLPVTPAVEWEGTGDWYRDDLYEAALDTLYKEQGLDVQVGIVTLDASVRVWAGDLSLTLGCLGSTKVAYLSPYSFLMPVGMDRYTVGVWNDQSQTWVEDQTETYRNPTITDDGSSIYIINNSQIRQIVSVLHHAGANQNPDLVKGAGIWDSTKYEGELWSDYDPTGLEDALNYLPCFN